MVMDNSYYQIGQQLLKNSRHKHYDIFDFDDEDQRQEWQNCEGFIQAFHLLKKKYQVIFKLFGEKNFEAIGYQYFLINPIHSSSKENYGKSFAEFLGTIEQIEAMKYLKWVAKLDWYWFHREIYDHPIQMPKGTLNSWANIFKGQDKIDIQIDESVIESVTIIREGNQFKIIAD